MKRAAFLRGLAATILGRVGQRGIVKTGERRFALGAGGKHVLEASEQELEKLRQL